MTAAPEPIPLDYRPRDAADLARCLRDPVWRIGSGALYRIVTKSASSETGTMSVPFKPNEVQQAFIKNLWHRNLVLKARQLGYCLDPSTRVLTADLRWVPIASLKPGDEVVAVDEEPKPGRGNTRCMQTATVQATVEVHRKAYRITFDDGRSVVCTGQHPWLSRGANPEADWRKIENPNSKKKLRVGTLVRWITKPWDEPTYEDGWFGGILDGEGSMSKPNVSPSICVAQRPGPVWDRMVRYCEDRGYNQCLEGDDTFRPSKFGKTPVPKLAFGRMDELFRLIGQTRPTRFAGRRFWEGRVLPGKRVGAGWARIVSIEPMAEQTMIDLQTSTGTYIAEGFVSHNTTLIALLWLDHALFNSDQRCGVIAQDREAAEAIFRDKVRYAYLNLPAPLRQAFPLARDSASELLFGHNNSSIRVATSMRSGTINRLHVSEFGKICAKFPEKAVEVVTGSLPAVPLDGVAIIESTAEGQEGEFYEMCRRAQAHAEARKPLTPRDYKFHFAAWHANPEYAMDPAGVVVTAKDNEYFDGVATSTGRSLSPRQRAWYVATRNADFAGEPELMWREYPSTPAESFQQSTEGTYYAVQLTTARQQGRIGRVPHVSNVPVNTFWDIGSSDGTAIWFHQRVGAEHRFIHFLEAWGEPYSFFISKMQALGWVWGKHYLPHDATHKRQQGARIASPEDMLRDLTPGWRFEIVSRVDEIQHGIQKVRDIFGQCWFDETACAEGLNHLSLYRKEWNARLGVWSDVPRHDVHSEAADAFRQFAQGWAETSVSAGARPLRRNRSGLAA